MPTPIVFRSTRARGLALWLCALSCTPASKRNEPLPRWLETAVAEAPLPGAVVRVTRSSHTVLDESVGFEASAAPRPLARNLRFRIASLSKAVTAAGVLLLRDRGALSLEHELSLYVPGFAKVRVLDAATGRERSTRSPLTLWHLMTHTSGLPYRSSAPARLAQAYAKADVSNGIGRTKGLLAARIDALARLPLAHDPGTRWTYGLSSDVLGRVIEVASEQSLDSFLEQELFEPLGMHDTGFYWRAGDERRLAAVYTSEGGRLQKVRGRVTSGALAYSAAIPKRGETAYLSGGAGLVSTLEDYARFARLLLQRGRFEGRALLSERSVREMTSHQIGSLRTDFGQGFGYGVSVQLDPPPGKRPSTQAGTFGWSGFFHTRFWVDPHRKEIGLFFSQLAETDVDTAAAFQLRAAAWSDG